MFLIEARGVKKVFGHGETQVRAVRGIDLAVRPGEFVAIMGPSGSGKSTFLHILGGLDVPDEGQVLFEGVDMGTLDDHRRTLLRRRRMGFVFQSFNLIPTLTAVENVELPLVLDGVASGEASQRAAEMLTLVEMSHRHAHFPTQLSGGEQQRVAIARALVSRPALILADEPTGNLDTKTGTQIIELLRMMASDHGDTVVMVTHDPTIAEKADRIVLIRDGAIAD
jgi:putative ABC transport system ATP-binding protein